MKPMDSQPRATDPRGSTSEQAGCHSAKRYSLDSSNALSNVPVVHGSDLVQSRSSDMRDRGSITSGSLPPSLVRKASLTGEKSIALPPTLPSFDELCRTVLPSHARSTEPAHDPSRYPQLSATEHDITGARLNQPMYESYPPSLSKEHEYRRDSVGSRSYSIGSPSSKRSRTSYDQEGRRTMSPVPLLLQSFRPPVRPESPGRGGPSERPSPTRVSQALSHRQLPAIYPVDEVSRGTEASPRTPVGSREHSQMPGNYLITGVREGAQTYPQATGSFPPPVATEQYHYEQPRHGYSWPKEPSSDAPSHQGYRPSYPPAHNAYVPPMSYGPTDRTPFSMAPSHAYGDSYHLPPRHQQIPSQRKRRGNLPKETTDKLRKWFLDHLTHPYPSEDEKQDMMRRTGLQMNQISNWFINARRRHLPSLQKDQDALNDRASGGLLTPNLSPAKKSSMSEESTDPGFEEGDDVDAEYHHKQPLRPSMSENHLHQMYQGRRSDLAPLPQPQQGYTRSPEQPRSHTLYAPAQISAGERDRE